MTKKLQKKEIKSLVFFQGNDKIVTDSLLIADEFEKRHKDVLKKIETAIERGQRLKATGLIFAPSEYKDKSGKLNKKYLLNRDAFFEIAMTFTGDRAFQLRSVFTKAFNRLEDFYRSQQSNTARIEARRKSIPIRNRTTDVVKDFVEYATAQGSLNAERYYCNLTKMENQALFFLSQKFKNIRDYLDDNQLPAISIGDQAVEKALVEGMAEGLNYHNIYKLAKERVNLIAQAIGKTRVPQFQIANQSKQLELFQGVTA